MVVLEAFVDLRQNDT